MYIKGQNFEFNYGVLNFKKGMKSERMRVVEVKMKKKTNHAGMKMQIESFENINKDIR